MNQQALLDAMLARGEENIRIALERAVSAEFSELRRALAGMEKQQTFALASGCHQDSLVPVQLLEEKREARAHGAGTHRFHAGCKANFVAPAGDVQASQEEEEEAQDEESEESVEEWFLAQHPPSREDAMRRFEFMYGIHWANLVWPMTESLFRMLAFAYVVCTRLESQPLEDLVAMGIQVLVRVAAFLFLGASIWVSQSDALAKFLAGRTHRDVHLAKRRSLATSFGILYCGPLFAVFSICWLIARFTVYADVEGSWFAPLPFPMEEIGHIIWVLWWLQLVSWLYVLLRPPWVASRSAIGDVIGRIDGGEVSDWDQMTAEFSDLSIRLDTLWSVGEAGATWVVAAVLAGLGALHSAIVYLHGWVHVLLYVWMNGSLCVGLLYLLAELTDACQATGALRHSIPAAAQRALSSTSSATSREQRRAHLGFIQFCRGKTAGIKLLEVQVDFSLVTRAFFTLVTIVPTIFTILRPMMKDQLVFLPSH